MVLTITKNSIKFSRNLGEYDKTDETVLLGQPQLIGYMNYVTGY